MQLLQSDGLRTTMLLACFAGLFLVFLLGTLAAALRKTSESGTRTSAYYDKGTLANMIIVYMTICLPITWASYSAFSQTNDPTFLACNVVAIFGAGLELEFHAKAKVRA